MKKLTYLIAALFVFCACAKNEKPTAPQPAKQPSANYARNVAATVNIIAYDVYNQKTAEGLGVYISHDVIVTPLAWFKGAFTAKITPYGSKQVHNVFGFCAVDLDHDLVALRIAKRNPDFAPLDTTEVLPTDTLHFLQVKKKKTFRTNLTFLSDTLNADLPEGMPVYGDYGQLYGIATQQNQLISAKTIERLRRSMSESHENIYDLRLKTNKKYPSYQRIQGFRISTTMGDIVIALSNKTPTYRDNFIRLVSDNFYDSLLIHRVLPNYLIQTGAADSKHAKADDVVGWQGPGYKLPMQLADGLFHKRGAVAASKLPQDSNTSGRSDGSQFYIVAGRKFTNSDLDQIEKEYGKRFAATQREAYTTIGGAPYLDGDYTVFGHVVSGMDVVDRIAATELVGDRPRKDIRIRDVKIIFK